jgi:hypothetical protein
MCAQPHPPTKVQHRVARPLYDILETRRVALVQRVWKVPIFTCKASESKSCKWRRLPQERLAYPLIGETEPDRELVYGGRICRAYEIVFHRLSLPNPYAPTFDPTTQPESIRDQVAVTLLGLPDVRAQPAEQKTSK